MTSTDKELARRPRRKGCIYGHGPAEGLDCRQCQQQAAAFWALFDPSVRSPMVWDDKRGRFTYRRR